MLTSNLNEHSNLSDIAAQVRKEVNRLLLTYFALIASVILLSLVLFKSRPGHGVFPLIFSELPAIA